MQIQTQIRVEADPAKVWAAVTDIENAANNIQAIEKIEILEKPARGLVGLKWRETRVMFGKEATEVMWVTEARENEFYATRAESHGAVYISTVSLKPENGATLLSMGFRGEAQTIGAKFFSVILGVFFKGATRKALHADLLDIKANLEG